MDDKVKAEYDKLNTTGIKVAKRVDSEGKEKYYTVNKIADGLYVSVRVNEENYLEGVENLQALNDKVTASDGIVKNTGKGSTVTVNPGFRYINTDSDKFNSGSLELKYQFAVINLSEEDRYGEGLKEIMYEADNKKYSQSDIDKHFEDAIHQITSNEYVINSEQNRLLLGNTGEYKTYGKYLGHNYYEGGILKDNIVKTTVHEIVDYLDNDASIVNDSSDEAIENRTNWSIRSNNEELKDVIDERVFIRDEKDNEVIGTPVKNATLAYKDGNIAITQESNKTLIKELTPSETITEDNIAVTTLNVQTLYSSGNKGEAGIDNFAEILVIENDVGRRDITSVYGNYDPRTGAEYTTERDESSAETVTLSPPTGNEENEKVMMTVAIIVSIIALASGAVANLKLNFLSKRNKNKKD